MNLRKRAASLLALNPKFAPWLGRASILSVAVVCLVSCSGGSGPGVLQSVAPAAIANLCPTAFTLDPPAAAAGAVVLAGPTPVPVQACTNKSECTALSQCTLDANKGVTIGAGSGQCGASTNGKVYVDKSFMGTDGLGTITIASDGKLAFLNQSTELDTAGIVDGGLLSVGTFQCRIAKTDLITIKFTGSRPCKAPDNCSGFSKGIEVLPAGSLRMIGAKGVPDPREGKAPGISWTYINAPAGPGAILPSGRTEDPTMTLFLADDVTGDWQNQDWIAVATTSFSPFETEFVKIADIRKADSGAPGGAKSIVDLVQPLKQFHFGSTPPTPSQRCMVSGVVQAVACGSVAGCTTPCTSAPSALNYNDPSTSNYGVDERAEVGLISRSIKLTADIPTNDSNSAHWGGEIKIVASMGATPKRTGEVVIQGVELEKFGKDQLGSYPIHFHMDGDVGNQPVVDANSIHHSFNKCITVHSTQNLTLSNNVCARVAGHLFYEELGDEAGISFINNLGLGAMSHSFDINGTEAKRKELIEKYWWIGDYKTNNPASMDYIGYDGFGIPDTDAGSNPVHGSCTQITNTGALAGYVPPNKTAPNCAAGKVYVEPASGFWILNPDTQLIGNSIGGCQGVGVGYWYLPPQLPSNAQYTPAATFLNNRVHGCFDGLFGEGAYSVSSSAQLHPHVDGTPGGLNLLARFEGLTATRNRDRGAWLRDQWFVIENGRFATNRDSATLLTAGGADGATPGDWMLVQDSVFEGLSQNNIDRFGPCPLGDTSFTGQQTLQGCIDQTPSGGATPRGGDEIGKGYPDPSWNPAGYMIYDGPARLYHDRFVNFKISPTLTAADQAALDKWISTHSLKDASGKTVKWVYEGDAAFGWFQSNQSSYPTLTNSKGLSFVNTDLRHQIYTQLVNLGKDPANPQSGFGDGDKNTAIIDLDGSLSGFQALDSKNNPPKFFDDPHPISLNNLMINASSNSVDECQSQGGQDAVLEKRPTSLMSPSSMASLEFQALYPPNALNPDVPHLQKQNLTFTNDSVDFAQHQSMTLSSRNALGVWEPKVTSALGYTVSASIDTDDKCKGCGKAAGIPKVIDVGLLDATKPHISAANPFYIRLGICYASANGKPASASSFNITRGYHSYGGGALGSPDQLELRKFYNKLDNLYTDMDLAQICDNLDGVNTPGGIPVNLMPKPGFSGCPANGISLESEGCPPGTTTSTDNRGQSVCIYPKQTLAPAASIADITNADGTFKDLTKYYYDPSSGWLFFYVVQQDSNSIGPSPLGNCGADAATKDPACPDTADKESYYVCPPEGCTDYVVTVTDGTYKPGASACGPAYPTYALPALPVTDQAFHLVYAGGTTAVQRQEAGAGTSFPHYQVKGAAPDCK
jgi:hypothetical protein